MLGNEALHRDIFFEGAGEMRVTENLYVNGESGVYIRVHVI